MQPELCSRGPLPERPAPTGTVTRGKSKSKSKRGGGRGSGAAGKPPASPQPSVEEPAEGKPPAVKKVVRPYVFRDSRALARGYMYDMTQYCRDNVRK